MLAWIFGVAVAVGAHVAPGPGQRPPVKVFTGPVVLARGTLVVPGDAKPATVELWMMSGETRPDGCAENYIFCGRAALQVRTKGHPTVITRINELVGKEEMCFDPPLGVPFRIEDLDESASESALGDAWPLAFTDFNHDGTLDLALGEHTCHDINAYFLFSFAKSGQAHRLPIAPGGVMWAPAGRLTPDMSEVNMTPDGFQITLIDTMTDPDVEFTNSYHWSPSASSFWVSTKEEKLTKHG